MPEEVSILFLLILKLMKLSDSLLIDHCLSDIGIKFLFDLGQEHSLSVVLHVEVGAQLGVAKAVEVSLLL